MPRFDHSRRPSHRFFALTLSYLLLMSALPLPRINAASLPASKQKARTQTAFAQEPTAQTPANNQDVATQQPASQSLGDPPLSPEAALSPQADQKGTGVQSQSLSQDIASAQSLTQQNCTPPPSGMVAWYPGDGNANDIQGGNHGTLQNGATFAPGKVGQAFNFSGNAFVSVPENISLNPQVLTLDAWIRTDGVGITNAGFVAAKSGSDGLSGYELAVGTPAQSGRLRFTLNGGAGGADFFSQRSVTDNVFHHVAATYDGATMKIYIDGQLDAQQSVALTISYPANHPLIIGRRELAASTETLPGLIDELELFNRALAQTEIQAIFNADSAGKCRGLAGGTLTVDNTNDSGAGSLRQAILDANSNAGVQTIAFQIPGSGVQTISPASTLPQITDPIVIDGTTQPSFAGSPLIELNGSSAGTNVNGLFITAGNSAVRGLVINRFNGHGILLQTGGGNHIEGNFIGTDVNGTSALRNAAAGVEIIASPNNIIGGNASSARNVLSGNGFDGVRIRSDGADGNLVQGNFIGTDVTGTVALGNAFFGVNIAGIQNGSGGSPSNNIVGGTTAGSRNVISGNARDGVLVAGNGGTGRPTGNVIQGNYIGTNAAGTAALNNNGGGVNIANAPGNTIGGSAAGAGNLIAFNTAEGVIVDTGAGNAVLSNSIFSNGSLGIHLLNGGNNNQAAPTLTSANSSGNNTTIQGTLNSTANTTFNIQFFVNNACDSSGAGEGQTFIGSTLAATDAQGNASFNTTLTSATTAGQVVTATATDASGNTSQFSTCRSVTSGQSATDVTWINTQGGNWNVAANWRDGTGANRVPTASDNVFINQPGTYTVTLNINATVNSLTLGAASGAQTFNTSSQTLTLNTASVVNSNGVFNLSNSGTLTGNGNLTVNGTLNWTGGSMSGTGATTITSGATFNIGLSNQFNLFLTRTLNNSGTAILTGSAGNGLLFGNGTFNNLSGALFDVRTDLGLQNNGGTNAFTNSGTFRKSTGTGMSVVSVAFNNAAMVDVQTGTLSFNGGGTSSGAFNVTAGATLGFGGGTHTLQAASRVNAASASVSFSGGTTNVLGSYNAGTTTTIAGTVTFSGSVVGVGSGLTISGTANFNSNDITISTLNLQNGTLGGSANVNVTGTSNWTGGFMSGAGATNIASGATLNIGLSNQFNLFLQRTLNNSGTAILTGSAGNGLLFGNGTFNNLSGAVFDVRTDLGLQNNGGSNLFTNAGTFRKSVGTGTSVISVPLNNNSAPESAVEVQTGTLSFNAGGTSGGAFNVSAGATLGFGGGTHTLTASSGINAPSASVSFSSGTTNVGGSYNAGTTTTIAGAVTFSGNVIGVGNALTITGTANFNSNDVTLATLNLQNGALGGSANIIIPANGTLNWTGGFMSGAGATNIASSATLNIGLSNQFNLFLQRTLNNSGTAILTGSAGNGLLFGNGTFNNLSGAVFDVRTDLGLQNNGGTNAFNNSGTLRKSVGTGTSNVSIPFNNSGTVGVQTGTLNFSGGGTSSGAFNAAAGTTLQFSGGTHTLQATSSVNAASASVSFSSGTTNVAGSYNAGTTTTIAGAVTFTGNIVNLGSALTVTGTANFNSNDITLSTLNLQGGALGGSAAVNVTGTLNWTGGFMSGAGVTNVLSGATLNIGLSNQFNLFLTRTLNNSGTAILTGSAGNGLLFGNGTFNNLSGALFDVRTDLGLQNNGGTNLFANAGTFRKSIGTGTSAISVPFSNTGTVESQTGTLSFSSTYTQTAGSTLLNGGNLATASSPINLQGGMLGGAGTITGNVSNGGTISPGASPGCLIITGSYTQTPSGRLNIEVGGTTPCAQFDRLNITGAATLGGMLNTSLINGFTPASNDSFPIMTFASRSGTFANVTGPLTPNYSNTGVTLGSAAPTPTPTPTPMPTAFTVTNTNDSGTGSLRQAILDANSFAGVQTITFNIPGTGVHTISPTSPLPVITDPVIIDGYTQPGAQPNTLPTGNNSVLLIELNGTNAGANIIGLNITAGNTRVKGLVINHFNAAGIRLDTNGGNTVEGNFLGTDANGTVAAGNRTGISIINSPNNLIGGLTPAARNVISGNVNNGVFINLNNSTGNQIQGNYIGTNAAGTAAVGNGGSGVINSSPNNVIGGTAAGAGNVISGNGLSGVQIQNNTVQNSTASGNLVQGNFIGTDAAGSSGVPNLGTAGVRIRLGSHDNTVGGTGAGAGNRIAFNSGAGVQIEDAGSIGNAVLSNSIFSNQRLGINLLSGGNDQDSDPSDSVTSAAATSDGTSTTVQVTFVGLPNQTNRIEFFANVACDPSGSGEGQTFIGAVTGTTDANGNGNINQTFPVNVPTGQFITATSTDPNNNDTTKFTRCVQVNASVFITGHVMGAGGVGVPGVTIALGGTQTGFTTTDANGNYSFALTAGTYTLTPAKINLSFTPASQTVTGSQTVNFTGTQVRTSPGKIVFVSRRDGNSEIYTMNADGTNQTRLTNNTATEADPTWAPDGMKIAFESDRAGNFDIFTMNADGTGQTNLTNNPAFDDSASWSPDGTRIAFASDRDDQTNFTTEIYVMNADGTNPVRLTNNTAIDEVPAWSPDGTKLAFRSDRDGNPEIYVMNADGSNQVRLTNNPAIDEAPAWSPDGARLVFHSNRDGNFEIYVMGADGSNQTRLTNDLGADTFPSYSPDGTQITFGASRDPQGDTEIYVMGADGGSPTNISRAPFFTDAQPTWQTSAALPPPTTLTVTSTNDSGAGSLRQAILDSNSTPGTQTIVFNITGAGPHTINVGSTGLDGLPIITDSVTIDGFTQGGQDYTGPPLIELNGASAGPNPGLNIAADNCRVRGLVINRFANGIRVQSGSGNVIEGNFIGTDVTGTAPVGNTGNGIFIFNASNNTIGGVSGGAGNRIAFNDSAGVFVKAGNGNAILSNSIFSNSEIGIGLQAGANNNQRPPVLSSADTIEGSSVIQGALTSAPVTTFNIQFFSNRACAPSGSGEGQTFIGSASVTTDTNGNGSFSTTLPSAVAVGDFVTATATDPNGNTSEFSVCRQVNGNSADLSVSITDSPDPVLVGSDLTYTIPVHNNGPSNATGVVLTDVLPSSVTFVSFTAGCNRVGGTVTCNLGALRSDSTSNVTITVRPNTAGTIINTAGVAASETDPNIANNSATESTTVVAPTFSISGRVTDESRLSGDHALGGITVTLSGTQTGIAMTDGSGQYSFNGLAAGGNYIVTPVRVGYLFTPQSQSFNNLSGNVTADFSGMQAAETPIGDNVIVQVGDIALTFTSVTAAGITTGREIDATTAGTVPGGYTLLTGDKGLDITTTATFTGPITLTGRNINEVSEPSIFARLRILHGENGVLVDRTILPPDTPAPDFSTRTISARVSSLSPFVLAVSQPRTISGRVVDSSNNSLSGVTLTLSGSQTGTTTSAADGDYSFTNVPAGGNYTVTPSFTGFTFTPASRTFNNLNSDQTANFTGTAVMFLGPSPYLSQADSPFQSSINAGTTFLETFEDGLLNTPGVSASTGRVIGPGGLTDSVDGDDGVIDGSGTNGHSFFSGNGAAGITFTFNAEALGNQLPTQAGIVWTDGSGTTTFEAFDANGASLGTVGPVAIADDSVSGTTGEDRFFGVTYAGGISAIKISNTAGGIEVDHLQYGQRGFACVAPSSGLVAWYPGDGNANDIRGNNNGTLQNGATFAPGEVNQAFSFDGVDASVTLNSSVGNFGRTDFSVEFWLKKTTSRTEGVLGKREACQHGNFFDVRAGAQIFVETDDGETYNAFHSNRAINDGQFHHVAIVRQGQTVSIYIDGALDASNNGLSSIQNSASFMFGRSACTGNDGTQSLTGELDEVQIFNRALSQGEIQAVVNAGSAGTCKSNGQAVSNYIITQTTNGVIVPGTQDIGNHCDDCFTPVTLPFPVTLYDRVFNNATITSNGIIEFTGATSRFTNSCLPDNDTNLNYTILGYFDDLRTDAANIPGLGRSGIFTSVTGTAPNRIFNVEWRSNFFNREDQFIHFEIRLYEGQQRFDVIYDRIDQFGNGATVGVQRTATTGFTQYECNTGGLTPGLQITFTGSDQSFISGLLTEANGAGVSGATVTLSGSSSASATTDASGFYSFNNLAAGGNYTVTPTAPNFTFTPPSQTFNNFSGSRTANFVGARATTFNISGRVADADINRSDGDNRLDGVTVTLSGASSATTVTSEGGTYSFSNLAAGGNYTVTPSLANFTFNPPSTTFNNLSANQTANFTGTATTFAISGRIRSFEGGLSGITVTLSGSASATRTTDAQGNYSFTSVVAGGNYTVTPSSGNRTFSPPNRTFNNLNANQNADFIESFQVATPVGTNVTVALGDFSSLMFSQVTAAGVTRAVPIDPNSAGAPPAGYAIFGQNLAVDISTTATTAGVITVCFSLPQITDPTLFASLRVLHGENGALVDRTTSVDFTNKMICAQVASLSPFVLGVAQAQTISGRVTDTGGNALSGASISLTTQDSAASIATTPTDANGNYTFTIPIGLDYTVTPTRSGFTFTPAFRTFRNFNSSQTGNFTGMASLGINGRVVDTANNGVPNVVVSLSGAVSQTLPTGTDGSYTFTGLTPGNYTVTVTSPNFVFDQPMIRINSLTASTTNQNITAVPQVVPTPTPPINDSFDENRGTNNPDPNEFNLGTVTQPPGSTDLRVRVTQQDGKLTINPVPNVTDASFNGYVTVRSVDFTNAKASVEVDQTTDNGAQTIFGIGSDPQNFFRFLVQDPNVAGTSNTVATSSTKRPVRPKDATLRQLIFQVRSAGVLTSLPIPYDKDAHKFWRFRHDNQTNTLNFETSPNQDGPYTIQRVFTLPGGIGSLATELTSGTAGAVANPGKAIFDNLLVQPDVAPAAVGTVRFSKQNYSVNEGAGSLTISVSRSGNMSKATSVVFGQAEGVVVRPCDVNDGHASPRCDFSTVVGTLRFAPGEREKSFTVFIYDDSYVEGDETFELRLVGATNGFVLDDPSETTITIIDNDTAPAPRDPINTIPFFVRQQYLDFLNREPEPDGFAAWSNVLQRCPFEGNFGPGKSGSDPTCDRITVSSDFFRSAEFQMRGFYIYRFYDAALGDRPNRPATQLQQGPSYAEFLNDMQRLSGAQSPEEQEANKVAFIADFIRRSDFVARYGFFNKGAQVDALLSTAGVVLANRNALVSDLESGRQSPAQVLRAIMESPEIINKYFNRAFVGMQYFGYLQRDPEVKGYNSWLNILNTTGDFRTMIFGFLYSTEYQSRFGTP